MSDYDETIKHESEERLLERYRELERKIESYSSESAIRIAQKKTKKIRNALVYRHEWTRAEANDLVKRQRKRDE